MVGFILGTGVGFIVLGSGVGCLVDFAFEVFEFGVGWLVGEGEAFLRVLPFFLLLLVVVVPPDAGTLPALLIVVLSCWAGTTA